MPEKLRKFFAEHWLLLLIAAQPVLDIIAFWTRNPEGTIAGTIRLAIMLILPLYLLITLKDKKRFILSMAGIAAVCLLHMLNCMRVGYINMRYDLTYMAKTAQLPILAVCFTYFIRDEQTKKQALHGFYAAAAILFVSIGLAVLTGTAVDTYGPGLGVSGWVIGDNRCANSVILVTLSVVALYYGLTSTHRLLNYAVPPLIAFVLISNGTKACYFSIFAVYAGFAVFFVIDRLVHGGKLRTDLIAVLLLCAIVSAAVYPITPRCRIDQSEARGQKRAQDELELIMRDLGYDLSSMTLEEKLADPVVVQTFGDYYWDTMWAVIPDMFARFSYEEILTQYKFTTSAAKIIDTRLMKRSYCALIWKDCDFLTKLVGFEVSDPWFRAHSELENDWSALYYYYGYLGLTAYVLFILIFIWRIIRLLLHDFKGALTEENFLLLMLLVLHLGLAQFSGSVLRRPNVSIYPSVILGLIYFQTALRPADGKNSLWGKRYEA